MSELVPGDAPFSPLLSGKGGRNVQHMNYTSGSRMVMLVMCSAPFARPLSSPLIHSYPPPAGAPPALHGGRAGGGSRGGTSLKRKRFWRARAGKTRYPWPGDPLIVTFAPCEPCSRGRKTEAFGDAATAWVLASSRGDGE
jgi:hypothetical protein